MIAVADWNGKSTEEKLKFLLDHILRLDNEAAAIRYKIGPIENEIGSLGAQVKEIKSIISKT